MADIMILAINASEIASFKEYIAYSAYAAYRRLLSPVDTDGCYIEPCTGSAESVSPTEPVNTALPWTQCAVPEELHVVVIV
jgi:hypothetical protein